MPKTKAVMPERTIVQRVDDVIGAELGVADEQIVPDASFIHDLGADSLTVIEICLSIEDEFDIEIRDVDLDRFDTVQKLRDFVEASLSGSSRIQFPLIL